MPAIVVTANNIRVEDAEAITGWSSIGGGAGGAAEASFPYQGGNLVNRKITSTTGAGFYYLASADSNIIVNTGSTATTYMAKFIVTDYGGLQATNGVRIRIGSGTGAYYDYITAGSSSIIPALSSYPPKGGIIIVPISPSVAAYRNSTTGSPNLAAVQYYGIEAAFSSSTAKSENVGLDAIDVGTGLTLKSGVGSAAGTFENFYTFDEGTVNNRFGYVTKSTGIYNVFGTLTIGDVNGTTATNFSDSSKTVVFPDGLFAVGWSGLDFRVGMTATTITLDNVTLIGRGNTTGADSRPVIGSTGSFGTLTMSGCSILNFNTISLTPKTTVSNTTINSTQSLTQNSATLTNIVVSSATTTSGVGFISSNNPEKISNSTFTFSLGHAITITQAGTYTFTNNEFNNYLGTPGSNLTSNSGSTGAAIYNNSGGLVTLNITGGGTTPSVRNGASATTQVNNNVSITFIGLKENTEVRVMAAGSESTELAGIENATDGTFNNRSFTWSVSSGTSVDYRIGNILYEIIEVYGFTPNADAVIPIQQRFDRSYQNL